MTTMRVIWKSTEPLFQHKVCFSMFLILIIKLRRSWNRLFFKIGIPILIRRYFFVLKHDPNFSILRNIVSGVLLCSQYFQWLNYSLLLCAVIMKMMYVYKRYLIHRRERLPIIQIKCRCFLSDNKMHANHGRVSHHCDYSDVTWTIRCPKSPATRLFAQPPVYTNNNKI